MGFLTDNTSINTILGEGSSFRESIKVNGNMRVEGDIDGSVDATGNIFVGERARIRGNVTAGSAEIYGIVIGDVFAPEFVKLLSTATVLGDICTKKVRIDDKAIFHGHCISHKDEVEFENAQNAWQTQRSVLDSLVKRNDLTKKDE